MCATVRVRLCDLVPLCEFVWLVVQCVTLMSMHRYRQPLSFLLSHSFLCVGTNVKEAKALIEGSGYRMIMTDDLDDAAEKAVKIADIVRQANEISVGVTFELPL
jgi:hypothetical protein